MICIKDIDKRRVITSCIYYVNNYLICGVVGENGTWEDESGGSVGVVVGCEHIGSRQQLIIWSFCVLFVIVLK